MYLSAYVTISSEYLITNKQLCVCSFVCAGVVKMCACLSVCVCVCVCYVCARLCMPIFTLVCVGVQTSPPPAAGRQQLHQASQVVVILRQISQSPAHYRQLGTVIKNTTEEHDR